MSFTDNKVESNQQVTRYLLSEAESEVRAKTTDKPVDCHKLVQQALADGLLTKSPCAYCGSRNVVGHHHDYRKPLDVVWVCRHHHARIHRKLLEAGRQPLNIHLSKSHIYEQRRRKRRSK